MIDISILLQIVWTGLAASSYAILFAVAFSLVVKVAKVWNFAQAGVMALSFYVMYAAHNKFAIPLLLSVVVGLVATIGANIFMDRYGLQTLRNIMSGVNIVFGIVISNWDIEAVCVTLALLFALYLFMYKTRDGQFMAAVADNPELSRFYGINVTRAYVITFVIAGILITAGMYLFGTKASNIPNTPLQMMLFAVIATLLGGMGRIFGAALAAITLSLIQGLSIFVIPSQWQGLILYVFLFITILFFPQGVNSQKFKQLISFSNKNKPLTKKGI